MDLDNPGCSSHGFLSSYSNTTDSLNQLWQCHPFSVLWLFRDHQFSGLVAVELQFVIDDSGSPIPNWNPKFCTPKNRSVLVNSGSGKDMVMEINKWLQFLWWRRWHNAIMQWHRSIILHPTWQKTWIQQQRGVKWKQCHHIRRHSKITGWVVACQPCVRWGQLSCHIK